MSFMNRNWSIKMDERFILFYKYDDKFIIGTIDGDVKSISQSEYSELQIKNFESDEIKFIDLSKHQNKFNKGDALLFDIETWQKAIKINSHEQVQIFMLKDINFEHWLITSFDPDTKLWILWTKKIMPRISDVKEIYNQ